MTLYGQLTPKQRRSVRNDIVRIISLKGSYFPKDIEEMRAWFSSPEKIFSPRIKINNRDVYLTDDGVKSARRICDFISQTDKYRKLLTYNDIFQKILAEVERWINDNLVPDDKEFIEPLDELLSREIKNYKFVCRVDGLSLVGIDCISIGNKEIRKYDEKITSGCTDKHGILETINKEYSNSLIITGTERGSKAAAEERFYHDAELSLSVLRLYSCALYRQAIQRVNIRLLKNSPRYEPAISFGWTEPEKDLNFTRHFGSVQDLKIEQDLLEHLCSNWFFNKIGNLVEKQERNELEEAVVKALHWIGEAQKDQSRPAAWLKLWSCLECFFTLGTRKITERNARGIAAILIFGGYSHEQYSDYQELKKKVKKYYELRSKIVHRAEHTQIGGIQLSELSYIVAWVIITMAALLNRGYQTLSKVREQIDRLDSINNRDGAVESK